MYQRRLLDPVTWITLLPGERGYRGGMFWLIQSATVCVSRCVRRVTEPCRKPSTDHPNNAFRRSRGVPRCRRSV